MIGDDKLFSDPIIERFLSLILPLRENIKEVYLIRLKMSE